MALASTEVTSSSYVLIGNNVNTITFQCQSSTPAVVAISTISSGIATDTPGLIYDRFEGEMKKTVTDLSHDSGAAYVYAKALTGTSKVVYEGA
jgi:spore maturation protein SpmA